MTTAVGCPRLHFGLFDLGAASKRIYGGVGAAIGAPPVQVSVDEALVMAIEVPAEQREELAISIATAWARLERSAGRRLVARVSVKSVPPAHVGLGSKTSTLLAVLVAARAEFGLQLTDEQLQLISGRAGTSGVGVHTFFRGGLVLDGGHRAVGARRFGPSSTASPATVPPMLVALEMPEDWEVALLLRQGRRFSAGQEVEFFNANTPIANAEVERTVVHATLDLASAVAERDIGGVAYAIREMQLVGFKAREVRAQVPEIQGMLRHLHKLDRVASGMSSVGPLVYAVYDDSDEIARQEVARIAHEYAASLIATTRFASTGFKIE